MNDAGNIVLMYHAVTGGSDSDGTYDPHYSVSAATLRRHLQIAAQLGRAVTSVADLRNSAKAEPCVAVTFDDGLASDAEQAVPILLDAHAAADFFVNSSTVGKKGFVTAAQLRDMAAAGMSIQSHGHTHRFLNDLDAAAVQSELCDSRKRIEDIIGKPVTLFAPPGGRLPAPGGVALIVRAGYAGVCTSRPGVLHDAVSPEVPRIPVLRSTTDRQLTAWMSADAAAITRLKLAYGVRGIAKRLLGNRVYVRLRGTALRSSCQTNAP